MTTRIWLATLMALGCSGSGSGATDSEGTLGGTCFPNATCNAGLVCVEDTCEQPADGGIADAGIADAGVADSGFVEFDANPACVGTTEFQYVLSELRVPTSAGEANIFALDIDGDGLADNALGGLLGALVSTSGVEFQTVLDEQIARGGLIQLASLEADEVASSKCASMEMFLGDMPSPQACENPSNLATCGQHLLGDASFNVATSTPTTSPIVGRIVSGEFLPAQSASPPATAFLSLAFFGSASETVSLVGAKVSASTTSQGLMSGQLGGGISEQEIDNKVVPALQSYAAAQVASDCTPVGLDCGCVDGSVGQQFLGFFDSNADCQISLMELATNSLIEATLRNPDLDLLDAAGQPGTDGVDDHLSVAVGFSAVGATF